MTGLYSVSWPDHATDRNSSIKGMLEKQSFVDVTIACDDDQVEAHKVLISAASPFFQKILERNPHAHPLLYLRGTLKKDVSAVLDFIYSGETSVPVNDFESFMSLAKDLEVKGLVDDNEVGAENEQPVEENREGTDVIKKKAEKQPRARNRQKQNTSSKEEQKKSPEKKIENVESAEDFEQVKLKEEPEDNLDMDVEEEVTMDQFLEQDLTESETIEPAESIEESIKMEPVKEVSEKVKKRKRTSKSKSNGGDLVKSNDNEIADNEFNSENLQENTSTNEATESSKMDLNARIEALLVTTADGFFVCNECRYGSKNEAHVREHIEMHIDGVAHKCKTCSRVFTKRMSLRFHENKCQKK